MAKLLKELASKTAPNAIDARLKADAERQGRAINAALNVFSGPDRDAAKGDDRSLRSSSGRSASLITGPGGVSIGMDGGSRPAAAPIDPLAGLDPKATNQPIGVPSKRLLDALLRMSAKLPLGEAIRFGASDVAVLLDISRADADTAINELRRLDLILPRYSGLGALDGYVVAKALRS